MTDAGTVILIGDVRAKLREIPSESVQCVVTSPPYWGLRNYGTQPQVWGGRPDCEHVWESAGKTHKGGAYGNSGERAGRDNTASNAVRDVKHGSICSCCQAWLGELGLEPNPDLFVEHIVEVFREVKRVLRPDGTCWVNMGDCYAGAGFSGGARASQERGELSFRGRRPSGRVSAPSLKPKDLVGQPWMVAFGLRADGWFLRSDIIWSKPNPMPESISDRPTKAHEYIFLLTKSGRYYYDKEAIKEAVTGNAHVRGTGVNPKAKVAIPAGWDTTKGEGGHGSIHRTGARPRQNASFSAAVTGLIEKRNARTVWTIPTEPYPEAHYATFPTAIPRRCILAGTKPGDTVLDPFGGSGTTGAVANALGRSAILIDLNPANEGLMRARILKLRNQGGKKTRPARRCQTLELPLEGVA